MFQIDLEDVTKVPTSGWQDAELRHACTALARRRSLKLLVCPSAGLRSSSVNYFDEFAGLETGSARS